MKCRTGVDTSGVVWSSIYMTSRHRQLTNSELSDLDAGELREHAAAYLAA